MAVMVKGPRPPTTSVSTQNPWYATDTTSSTNSDAFSSVRIRPELHDDKHLLDEVDITKQAPAFSYQAELESIIDGNPLEEPSNDQHNIEGRVRGRDNRRGIIPEGFKELEKLKQMVGNIPEGMSFDILLAQKEQSEQQPVAKLTKEQDGTLSIRESATQEHPTFSLEELVEQFNMQVAQKAASPQREQVHILDTEFSPVSTPRGPTEEPEFATPLNWSENFESAQESANTSIETEHAFITLRPVGEPDPCLPELSKRRVAPLSLRTSLPQVETRKSLPPAYFTPRTLERETQAILEEHASIQGSDSTQISASPSSKGYISTLASRISAFVKKIFQKLSSFFSFIKSKFSLSNSKKRESSQNMEHSVTTDSVERTTRTESQRA